MGRLYAMADLHLSQIGAKPMDRFGEPWRDHAQRMARAWDATLGPEDTILLCGDLSWGRNAAEAAPDLAWIGARPGRKILLRGNHDGWWRSPSQVRSLLPAGCDVLHNNAIEAQGWVVVGARGWTAPDDPVATPEDERVFRRELERLRLSLVAADRDFGRAAPRLAAVHFPPRLLGRPPSAVVEMLARGGVRVCVYGHLHGEDHELAVRGEHDGIHYEFVAVDAVGFRPVLLQEPPA